MPALPEAIYHEIMRVSRTHPEWGTIDGAFGQCQEASRTLRRILLAQREATTIEPIPIASLGPCHPHWERFRGKEHCIAHYAVRWHRTIIDLTARQFDAAAPFPHITPF